MLPQVYLCGGSSSGSPTVGPGSTASKLGIKSACRLVPVHPHDRHLLGVEWQGECYVDGALPFGLRSAPKIFTAVADALQWIMMNEGVSLIEHYLDDFITMGPPDSGECGRNLDRILAICRDLGVLLALEKLEGPSHCLTFLGIEMDTLACKLRLPADKLCRLKATLAEWSARRSAVGVAYRHLVACLSGCETGESIPKKDD